MDGLHAENGEYELGFQTMSEQRNEKGVDQLGPTPRETQVAYLLLAALAHAVAPVQG